MSEIVSFYDWYLDQRNKPRTEEPKDIEDEDNENEI